MDYVLAEMRLGHQDVLYMNNLFKILLYSREQLVIWDTLYAYKHGY